MKLAAEARDVSITFSITMPMSLYHQITPLFGPRERSKVICGMIRAALALDPLLNSSEEVEA